MMVTLKSNQVILNSNWVILKSNQVIFKSNQVIFKSNQVIFKSNWVIKKSNRVTFKSYWWGMWIFSQSIHTVILHNWSNQTTCIILCCNLHEFLLDISYFIYVCIFLFIFSVLVLKKSWNETKHRGKFKSHCLTQYLHFRTLK